MGLGRYRTLERWGTKHCWNHVCSVHCSRSLLGGVGDEPIIQWCFDAVIERGEMVTIGRLLGSWRVDLHWGARSSMDICTTRSTLMGYIYL